MTISPPAFSRVLQGQSWPQPQAVCQCEPDWIRSLFRVPLGTIFEAATTATAKSLQSCPLCGPHTRQPSRLPRLWDFPGKNTGMGCHCLLQSLRPLRFNSVLKLSKPAVGTGCGPWVDSGCPAVITSSPDSPAGDTWQEHRQTTVSLLQESEPEFANLHLHDQNEADFLANTFWSNNLAWKIKFTVKVNKA